MATSIVTWVLAIIAVGLRILSRRMRHMRLWTDDWLIIAALVHTSRPGPHRELANGCLCRSLLVRMSLGWVYTVSDFPKSTSVSSLLSFSMSLNVFTSREPWLRQTRLGRPAGRTIRMGNWFIHRRAGILRHHYMRQVLHPCLLLARIQSHALCHDPHLHPGSHRCVLGHCCCKCPVQDKDRDLQPPADQHQRSSSPSSNAGQPVLGGIASTRRILCSQTSTTAR